MRQLIHRVGRGFGAAGDAARGVLRERRKRWNWFDHLIRAYRRYQDRRGDRLAAALTSYGFLSFFPLLALAYALLGYLVGVSDQAREFFVDAVYSLLPGMSEQLEVEQIAQSKAAAGLLGLAGLLLTGLAWVQVLRESLRDIWGKEPQPEGNFLVRRVWDAGVLILLGLMLIVGVAVTTVTNTATHIVLGWLELDEVSGAGTALRLVSLGMAIASNTVIFLVLFSRLSGTMAPWRTIFRGALLGALGFEVLKQVATLLLGNTMRSPVYASFAVLIGLMIWINIVSRFLLLVAAWTATRRVVLAAETLAAPGGGLEAEVEVEPGTELEVEPGAEPGSGGPPAPEDGAAPDTGARDDDGGVTAGERRPAARPRTVP